MCGHPVVPECRNSPSLRKMLSLLVSLAFAATTPPPPPPLAAEADTARRVIVVSLDALRLWLMVDDELVHEAPIGVGSGKTLANDGRSWTFNTPRGVFHITSRQSHPDWVPPLWHYHEQAVEDGLQVRVLRRDEPVELEDGSWLEVRGEEVGRVNWFGNFWPFDQGSHIIFDATVFVPPIGTVQRRIPGVLGTRRLNLVDGYALHGTNAPESVPGRTSHGCIRMRNEDIEIIFPLVRVGTMVLIY
jgi:hypothetical protein